MHAANSGQRRSSPVIVIMNQRPSRQRYMLARALTASSRGGRGEVRVPQRMPCTWIAFHHRPLAMSDVDTIVPRPVRSRW